MFVQEIILAVFLYYLETLAFVEVLRSVHFNFSQGVEQLQNYQNCFIFHWTVKKVSSPWLIINLSSCIMALSLKKKKGKKKGNRMFLYVISLVGWFG